MKPLCSDPNTKTKHLEELYGKSACFDLPAGETCPQANICKAIVRRVKGVRRMYTYPETEFKCYAAKAELIYPATFEKRRRNYRAVRRGGWEDRMINELESGKIKILRLHSSGDFFSWSYYRNWINIMTHLSDVKFFAYSKQASFVKWIIDKPMNNFHMVYSHGGLQDEYAKEYDLPTCYVRMPGTEPVAPVICGPGKEAEDYEWIRAGKSFSLDLH